MNLSGIINWRIRNCDIY